MTTNTEPVICEACQGSGYIEVKHVEFVTKDMAIDGGDFGLQGQLIATIEHHTCGFCHGDGFLIEEPEYYKGIGDE